MAQAKKTNQSTATTLSFRQRRRPGVYVSLSLLATGFVMIFLTLCSHTIIGCDALSNSVVTSATSPATTNNNLQIRVANIADPAELQSLQDCRRTAFDPNKQKWLNSERDFCAAQSVIDEKHLCVVALNENQQVVGSADLYPMQKGKNTIMNVFVRPDQRGKGIGRQLMVDGIEQVLVPLLEEPNLSTENQETVLSLDVYTQNKPAIELYLKLGYEPSSAMHAGTLKLAQITNSNLVVSLSKTVPVE